MLLGYCTKSNFDIPRDVKHGNPANDSSGLHSLPFLSAFHQNTFQGIFPNLLRISLREKFTLKRFEKAFTKLELSPRKLLRRLEALSIPRDIPSDYKD